MPINIEKSLKPYVGISNEYSVFRGRDEIFRVSFKTRCLFEKGLTLANFKGGKEIKYMCHNWLSKGGILVLVKEVIEAVHIYYVRNRMC
jgi:hypothetical protein